MPNQVKSWPDWKYPEWRNSNLISLDLWLKGRREGDGAEGLWRVHDNLYDLSTWLNSHPGGSEWLINTKGTDITEAFEAHHIRPTAAKMLANFYVRAAKTKRNSAFTFKPDGFYNVFKSKAYEKLKNTEPGPSRQSKMVLDSLATITILLTVIAAVKQNYVIATFAGLFLAQTGVVAHNFFHMRDNWRMYMFNLTLLTVREWRISHALSHHLFPNTHYDLEISMFEPFLVYLPKVDKTKISAALAAILSPLIYSIIFFGATIIRISTTRPQYQDLICLLLPTLMALVGQPVLNAVVMWLYIQVVSSFCFGVIGLNAAHHHPDIFHYGDKPRDDRDWGLFTLDATRDRVEIHGSPYLVLISFGDHTLHHMFPALDHSHLHSLYPVLEETCKEFGIDFKLTTTWDLIKGQFQQLMRNKPNLKERSY